MTKPEGIDPTDGQEAQEPSERSPVERITEVLREHREELNEEGVCICGWHENNGADYPQHAAIVVLRALGGLTEEHRELADGAGGISTNMKTGVTTAFSKPCTKLRRWVSPWVRLQP